jgi:hypothetical protein
VELPNIAKWSCTGAAALAVLTISTAPGWAIACAAPAPVFGVTGPIGLVIAGAVYGSYLLYNRYQDRG